MRGFTAMVALAGALLLTGMAAAQNMSIEYVSRPDTERGNDHYVGNAAPLLPSPFYKLPVGSIQPRGWLGHQLGLMRDGQVGQLPRISPWCVKEGNAWLDPEGTGKAGWEELPYWLKGYGDLAYILDDKDMIAEALVWIEGILASQRADGWFGPLENEKSLDGAPDLWPNMIALNCLQSYHEYTSDPRVIDFMTRYFEWQLAVPEDQFMRGYWPAIRAGDNLESVYWLYNRTRDGRLIELAHKIHRCMARWDEGVINWHGVNITQGFREPAEYYVLSHDPAHLDATVRNYDEVMAMTSRCLAGCSARTRMHDPAMMTRGRRRRHAAWSSSCIASRCSGIPFGLIGARRSHSTTSRPRRRPTWSLHYPTAPNMPRLDKPMTSRPAFRTAARCSVTIRTGTDAANNVSHGWPHAEHLWMAAPWQWASRDATRSPSSATVGDGVQIRITESTGYPSARSSSFTLSSERAAEFPIFLRGARMVRVGQGRDQRSRGRHDTAPLAGRAAGAALGAQRGCTPHCPCPSGVDRWLANHQAASVSRGPLTYSLAIDEEE